jgi:hypothetical protein
VTHVNRRTLDLIVVGLLLAFGLGYFAGYAPQHARIARQAACIKRLESSQIPGYTLPEFDFGYLYQKPKAVDQRRLALESVTMYYFDSLTMNWQECDRNSGLATLSTGTLNKWLGEPDRWMAAHYHGRS